MQTKTAIRKGVGRGKFTVARYAEAAQVSAPVARRRLAKLEAEGVVTRLPDTAKVTGEDGEPSRGRPRHQFKVAGK